MFLHYSWPLFILISTLMSARKERVFLLMIKNVEVCKKEYTFLKLQWEKWGTYRSRILTCNNISSHRKYEQLSNWACVVIFMFIDICLFDVYCLLCRACKRHHTYDVKNVYLVYWVLIWCDNSLNLILFVVSNCICLSKCFTK